MIDLKRKFPSKQIYEWSCEMIEGMYYLHSNRIIHRDIKPSYIIQKYFFYLKFKLYLYANFFKAIYYYQTMKNTLKLAI